MCFFSICTCTYTDHDHQGWLSNNLAPHYVRATGIGFEIAFANCAAFIASFIYIPQDAYVFARFYQYVMEYSG